VGGADGGVFRADAGAATEAFASLERTRATRDPVRVRDALAALVAAAQRGAPIMEASIACALARVTTGEWGAALRGVFGDYRAETGVAGASIGGGGESAAWDALRARVAKLPRRPKLLVGKPGLDGHSNGAEVIAVAARDAGFEVVYAGIRLEPAALAATAVQEAVDIVGLSLLSGSHLDLTAAVLAALRERGAGDIPVVIGGVIPAGDHAALHALGVRRVFTPSDYKLVDVVGALVDTVGTA
jgi:(2R)-ethylmalonyl-CoA mutase